MRAGLVFVLVLVFAVSVAVAAVGYKMATQPSPTAVKMADETFTAQSFPPGQMSRSFTMAASGQSWILDIHIWADEEAWNVPIDGSLQCVDEPYLTVTTGGANRLHVSTTPQWFWVGISGTNLDAGDVCVLRFSDGSAPNGFYHTDAFVLWGYPPPASPPPPGEPATEPSTPSSSEPKDDSTEPVITNTGTKTVPGFEGVLVLVAVALVFIGMAVARRGRA